MRGARSASLALFAALITAGNGAAEAAARAVSLDYCADQYLIALAARDQIAAVSPLATSAFSRLRAEAAGLAQRRPDAEEILALRPDLVIRAWGGAPRLETFLDRMKVRVVTLSYASDFDGVRANIRAVAAALGRAEAGAALIADLDRRLAALAASSWREPGPALYVTPGGVTAGRQTMIDAILAAAGVANRAALDGLDYWPPLPAETLVARPPDLLVAGFFEGAGEAANHWSAARHPVLRRLFAEKTVIHLPADILSCPTWLSVEASETIAAELARERRRRDEN